MKRIFSLLLAFLFIICLAGCAKAPTPSDSELWIKVLSTGNSDCILIKTDDANILIDTADEDDSDLILEELSAAGMEDIDLMIITHFDNDHVGSAARIIYEVPVKQIVAPDYVRTSKRMTAMNAAIDERGPEYKALKEDLTLSLGGCELYINAPKNAEYSDENSYSLITELEFSGERFIFTGDATEERLNEYIPSMCEAAQFVKLPHHGDYNAAVKTVLEKSGAGYGVVCTDTIEQVMDGLTEAGRRQNAALYFTYNGAVTLGVQGDNITAVQTK